MRTWTLRQSHLSQYIVLIHLWWPPSLLGRTCMATERGKKRWDVVDGWRTLDTPFKGTVLPVVWHMSGLHLNITLGLRTHTHTLHVSLLDLSDTYLPKHHVDSTDRALMREQTVHHHTHYTHHAANFSLFLHTTTSSSTYSLFSFPFFPLHAFSFAPPFTPSLPLTVTPSWIFSGFPASKPNGQLSAGSQFIYTMTLNLINSISQEVHLQNQPADFSDKKKPQNGARQLPHPALHLDSYLSQWASLSVKTSHTSSQAVSRWVSRFSLSVTKSVNQASRWWSRAETRETCADS